MAERTVRALGVAGPGRPVLLEDTEPAPGPGQAWLSTVWSGVSVGTELALVTGVDPHHVGRWDRELRAFSPGPSSSPYPILGLGYMEVGEVTESRTPELAEGALMAAAYGHRTGRCVDPARDVLLPLPAGLDPVLGIYLAQMGPICANGILHAAAELHGPGADLYDGVRGRHVLVTGAGVVGLLSALLAVHGGAAAVAVADADPARRAVAERLGLATFDDSSFEAWLACKTAWRHGPGDHGADLVLQCRGRDTALATALKALRPQGTVIDLAFYSAGAGAVRLGEEFHHNGLTIRCAQIGRVPRGMAGSWDRRRLCAATLDLLLARGADVLAHLVTDRVAISAAPAFFVDLAERRRSTLTAVLDMRA